MNTDNTDFAENHRFKSAKINLICVLKNRRNKQTTKRNYKQQTQPDGSS